MEVGAATPSSYLPSQFAETRQAKGLLRDISSARDSTVRIGGERQEGNNSRALVGGFGDETKVSQATPAAEAPVPKSLRNEAENRSAAQARESQRPQQSAPAQAGGSIKLDVEDGVRVLKVFDSKDVLIYQLPPKGALMLIKAQEQEQQSQVQTSA